MWPPEFEELLDEVRLPGAEIDMPLREYASLVCTLLDIPVHKTVVEPLHVLFTLFSDFKVSATRAPHARQSASERGRAWRGRAGEGGGTSRARTRQRRCPHFRTLESRTRGCNPQARKSRARGMFRAPS
jgi:hypothetical protein